MIELPLFGGKSMSIIGLLSLLLIFCVVVWAVRALLSAFAVPEPIATVVWVLVVLLCVFALIGETGLVSSVPVLRLR